MPVTKTNDYDIATNADLGNVLNNVDLNRIGADLTALELDGGTVKVSVGSLIESQGNLYKVDTAAVTPTGTAQAGAYLFFDDSVPGFVWSTTPGTYDPARGGIYDASNRRRCQWILLSDSTFYQIDEKNRFSRPAGTIGSLGNLISPAVAINNFCIELDRKEGLILDVNATDYLVKKWDGTTLQTTATLGIVSSAERLFKMSPGRVAAVNMTAPTIVMLNVTETSISQVGNTFVNSPSDAKTWAVRVDNTTLAFLGASSFSVSLFEFDGTNWSATSDNPNGFPERYFASGVAFSNIYCPFDGYAVYTRAQNGIDELVSSILKIDKGTATYTELDRAENIGTDFFIAHAGRAATNFLTETQHALLYRTDASPYQYYTLIVQTDGSSIEMSGMTYIGESTSTLTAEFKVLKEMADRSLLLFSRDSTSGNATTLRYGMQQTRAGLSLG